MQIAGRWRGRSARLAPITCPRFTRVALLHRDLALMQIAGGNAVAVIEQRELPS